MTRHSPWPVLMVGALLAVAALACSIDVSTAHFENARLYKTAAGDDSTRSFEPDDTVFCIVDLKDVEGELPVRAVWSQIEESEEGEIVTQTALGEQAFDSANARLVVELSPPDGGWPKGRYVIDLYLDGDKRETLNFSVK
jgi:hypothetical protein